MISPIDGETLWRVLTLADYNTRVVVLGTTLFGASAGLVGSLLLLRKRALLGDAIGHAALPGVAIAFGMMIALGGTGREMWALLLGASLAGLLGVGAVSAITRYSRIKDDAAIGIVLSVFYGFGIVLLGMVSRIEGVNAAGLSGFIYGRTASMLAADAYLIASGAVAISAVCLLLWKELGLLCFDPAFAAAQGWPAGRMDALLMALIVLASVIGLQAVGLILVVALLVIPAAAARYWTDRLGRLALVSAGIGAISGLSGALISALFERWPSGALIVLCASAAFGVSLVLGSTRGLLWDWLRRRALARRVADQHLLRALFEASEGTDGPVPLERVLALRTWSKAELRPVIRRAVTIGLVQETTAGLRLSPAGTEAACRITRNHRLWERYLLEYADVAPSLVDRDADRIEHVLGPDLVRELESLVDSAREPMPQSPHRIGPSAP